MKRGKINPLALVLGFTIFLAVAHSFIHFAVFGVTAQENAVSGLVIGGAAEGLKESYQGMSALSKTIIFGEWILIFMILSIAIFKNLNSKMKLKKDIGDLHLESYPKTKTKTDIDLLYEVLSEKKHLRISSISELFKIEYNLAMEWAKILEAGELASIKYPMLGEPEVVVEGKA